MANSYKGPSRLDLLVLIHNYNIIEDHKDKIAISETITDPDDLVLFQARTARTKKPKNQAQTDIDNSIKQLWNFKKHVDGFKELRAKDWERIVWATNTLRFLVPYCRGKSLEVAANAKVKTEQANKTVVKLELKGTTGMKEAQPSNSAADHNVAAPNLKHKQKSDIKLMRPSQDVEPNTAAASAPILMEQPVKTEEGFLPTKQHSVAKRESITFTKETKAQIKEQATSNTGEKPKEKAKPKENPGDNPKEKPKDKPKSKEKTSRRAAKDIDKLKSRSTPKVQEQKAAEAYEAARKLASGVRKF